MAAKVLTTVISAADVAALKVAIDAWLNGGYVVIDVEINDAQTSALIFYYA